MSKVKFTEEQQKELRNNKYTARVTANSLSFTKEFKELFYQEYQMGSIPREKMPGSDPMKYSKRRDPGSIFLLFPQPER